MCGFSDYTAIVKKELHQHSYESQFILNICKLHTEFIFILLFSLTGLIGCTELYMTTAAPATEVPVRAGRTSLQLCGEKNLVLLWQSVS